MLEGLKRLFSGRAAAAGDWEGIEPWAASRQYSLRVVQGDGFVIDGRAGSVPWRLEWGPSQRPYISGHELRLRAELGLNSELQVVLMNRVLAEEMERDVFEQYVEGVQTRIDNQTPPEMRWLVMFPKLPGSEMGPLREHFVALGSIKGWLQRWLDGPLMSSLSALRLDPHAPIVMMIGRGRLMLRTGMPDADVQALQVWLRLFEVAMREAQRVASGAAASTAEAGAGSAAAGDSVAASTQSGAWSSSALPGDEHPR